MRVHVCMHVYACVCMRVHVCVHVYACVCMHVHVLIIEFDCRFIPTLIAYLSRTMVGREGLIAIDYAYFMIFWAT